MSTTRAGLASAVGLLTAAYGLLVLVDVLAHEADTLAIGLLVAGVGLLAAAQREPPAKDATGTATRTQIAATLGLGLTATIGVLAYNAIASSTLSLPELAILTYGILLVPAANRLDQAWGPVSVGQLVAWSLPLIAAPLGVYALDAALDAGVGSSPLDLFIRHVLVPPMTASLDLLGFDVTHTGQTVELGTPRGTLFLTVGLVCAGLQPGILFLGVLGLHTWRERVPTRKAGVLFALGALSVYVMNLARLVVLALVGYRWGGAALQSVHAHAGWILFVLLVLAFWGLVVPRVTPSTEPSPS